MTHKKYVKLIQEYIDGEISRANKRELEEHLKTCTECRKKLEDIKSTVEILRSSRQEVKTPESLDNEILNKTIYRKVKPVFNWKLAAAGIAALLILGILIFTYVKILSPPTSMKKAPQDIEKIILTHKDSTEKKTEKDKPVEIQRKDKIEKDIIDQKFEETRLVFPEEGSVVGDSFDVVVILRKDEKEIELNIDGEVKKYRAPDSKILFIESRNLPFLDRGMHYISLGKGRSNLMFYKEG